jgi:glycosyltransferase involved in cell wall biosynthesis
MTVVPRLGIGLPVYNGENYLEESLDALLGQSYEDFELIISDNASTDSTGDICRRYAKQDSRIRYIRQPRNIGLVPNHNFVFQQSCGELFKWAASDDLYARDLLKCCIDALDEYPDVVLAHSWTAGIDSSGKVTQCLEYPLATDSPRAPERFRSFLFGSSGLFDGKAPDGREIQPGDYGVIRGSDQYGVIRSDIMRRVAPLASYHHSDMILIAEILLNGPFHQTADWLYFRRDHPDRAYCAHPTIRARAANLDPARASRLRNPTARLLAENMLGYFGAIRRAPLAPAERRECYRHLARWMQNRAAKRILRRPDEQADDQLSGVPDDVAV